MLLSDKLLELGRNSNPKNNSSMGNQCTIMHEEIKKKQPDLTSRQLFNIVKFACDTLNKEGYRYYKVDIFFEK
jgi:hypothetical protein